jgi:hypothetical protein
LEGLPNVLLHKILCIVWDSRPASEASSEVQLALSLQCLSRRFQQVLRAHPLQLRLDFSDRQLAQRHLAWLALPAWKDHVASLSLYNWLAPACEGRSRNVLDPGLCAQSDVVSPLLTVLRANQRGSLRRLQGMPLRLGGVRPPPDYSVMSRDQIRESLPRMPLVDLSAFHLTHLGVSGGLCDVFQLSKLPQIVVSLVYRAAYTEADVGFSPSFAAAEVQLPNLAGVTVGGGSPVIDLTCSRVLDGWHATIEGNRVSMIVWSAGHFPTLPRSTLAGTREVRINANYIQIFCMSRAGEEELGLEALVDLLCPPCLESMELISGCDYPKIRQHLGQHEIPDAWRLVIGKMMSAYGSKFAFQVDAGLPKRAAWRCWPLPGTQEYDAACRLHAEARTWAGAEI